MCSEVYWGNTVLGCCLSYKGGNHAVSVLMELRKKAEETGHQINNRMLDSTRDFQGTEWGKRMRQRSGSID